MKVSVGFIPGFRPPPFASMPHCLPPSSVSKMDISDCHTRNLNLFVTEIVFWHLFDGEIDLDEGGRVSLG